VAFAATAAPFLFGLELSPAACLLCFQLGSGLILEGFVVFHQVEADAVDAVGGVDGGFDLALAAVEGVEEGDGDGGVVLGSAIAHLIEGIAEGRVAAFGEMAHPFGAVAGAVGDGVVAGEGPDLSGTVEAVDGAHSGEVGSSVHFTEAGDGGLFLSTENRAI